MKLLFTKTKFEREFKEALGYVDANFPMVKILPDLRNATRELIEIIGKPTYESILTVYEEDCEQRTENNQTILTYAQNAVANMAYQRFAPSNDLQHGVNGRKMLTSEESKTPFEHMIVASNDELSRRSFRALDDLIDVLDEYSLIWKASDEYKETYRLFVRTTKEFDNYYHIGSRFLLQKLSHGLKLCERREILPRIGQEIFDKLKTDRMEGNPLDEDLLMLIQEATVYYALYWGVSRLEATMFPEGILQSIRSERMTIKARHAFTGNQIDKLEQLFKADFQRTLKEIEMKVAPELKQEPIVIPETSRYGFSIDDKFVT